MSSEVLADLCLDGTHVTRVAWDGLLGYGVGSALDRDDLAETHRISPRTHTLRFDIDPTNLIHESDESDNSFELTLDWGIGPAPPPIPSETPESPPTPPERSFTLPNLAPATPCGWDASIVGNPVNRDGTPGQGLDGYLTVQEPAFISHAIWNRSPAPTGASFEAKLFLDGDPVGGSGFQVGSGDAGAFWTGTVELPAGLTTPGSHTLRLVIDFASEIAEADEADNVHERVLEWREGPAPPPAPAVTHEEAELRALLAPLDGLTLRSDLLARGGVVEPADAAPILDIGEAAYYLATGSSLDDQRLTIELLTRPDYESALAAACLERVIAEPDPVYMSGYVECVLEVGRTLGLTTRTGGRTRVYVDADQSPTAVLNTLFHELGHARQDLLAPRLTEAESPTIDNLQEAQAQTFEAVLWRYVDELLGTSNLRYPAFPAMVEAVERQIDGVLERAADGEEHGLGYLLMWPTALRDPAGLGLLDELRSSGRLSAASSGRGIRLPARHPTRVGRPVAHRAADAPGSRDRRVQDDRQVQAGRWPASGQ